MNIKKLVSAVLLTSGALFAHPFPRMVAATGDVDYADKKIESDMEPLRRWLSDKRLITVRELGGDLSLSGEVRTEFQNTNETRNGQSQRGVNKLRPGQAWDIEVNLMLDYRTDFTWAAIKLEFDNDMGVRSGTVNKLRLEKAYLGGRFVAGDTFTFDGEIGRRQGLALFDSKVEFAALLDGVFLRFNKAFVSIGDYYLNACAFLVDDRTNHYAYVMEMGGLRIANIGLGMKYSLIDWIKHFSDPLKSDRYRFLVQQMIVFYQFNPTWLWKKLVKIYAAGVNNIAAHDLVLATSATDPATINFGKQNWGWYVGLVIGQAKKKGNFAIEIDYQWVQAQAIPDYDFSGIGRGNAAGIGLYTTNIDGSGTVTNAQTAVGPCNYRGFEIDFLYLFTNNLLVELNFKLSNTLNKGIGPDLKYNQFETEFIYAF
jgi:hypothetical protein